MKIIRAKGQETSRLGDEAPYKEEDCGKVKDHFEGNVWTQSMFVPLKPIELRAYLVYFERGARTNWHKHPEFQILYVVAGKGRVESLDKSGNKQASKIAPGDIVHFGTEKHWHGAAPDSFMIHLAIQSGETCWLEKVKDGEYNRGFVKR